MPDNITRAGQNCPETESSRLVCYQMVHDMHELLLGDNKSDKPQGLKDKVNRHEAQLAVIYRVLWLIVAPATSAVVVALVVMVAKQLVGE